MTTSSGSLATDRGVPSVQRFDCREKVSERRTAGRRRESAGCSAAGPRLPVQAPSNAVWTRAAPRSLREQTPGELETGASGSHRTNAVENKALLSSEILQS